MVFRKHITQNKKDFIMNFVGGRPLAKAITDIEMKYLIDINNKIVDLEKVLENARFCIAELRERELNLDYHIREREEV